MTDKEKELFNGFLSKTLNLDSEVIAGLYNQAGELHSVESLLTADAERIGKIKTAAETTAKNQYGRGIKESMTKFEKDLRDKYSVDATDLVGLELVAFVIEKETEALKAKAPEAIEKHPEYVKIQKAHEKALKEAVEKKESEINDLKSSYSKKETLQIVKATVLKELEKMENIIFPKNPTVKNTLLENFLRDFESGSYKIEGEGEQKSIIFLDDEGKPKTDSHGHILQLSDVVKERSDVWFEKGVATPRQSPGLTPEQIAAQAAAKKYTIKSKDDFVKLSQEAKTPDERIAIATAYKEFQKQS